MIRIWLRWSARDLRARWLQVVAIAFVIALGTGSYSGLSSVTQWRRVSMDAGYATLNMYDLRIKFAEGATVEQGTLAAAARGIPSAASITALEERLLVDLQLDASTPERAIFAATRIYGSANGNPEVNRYHLVSGQPLSPADPGQPAVLLERNFAYFYRLPAEGTLTVSGGRTLQYTGQAITPEYFYVTSEADSLLAEAGFAAVFTSLATAQEIAGQPNTVNDAVLTLAPGADAAAVSRELAAALDVAVPGSAATVMLRAEDPAYRLLSNDIRGDQQVYDIFAGLIFAGAVFAAFNLITRVVESQRREIGIAMVLGLPPHRVAVRPLLFAAEVAALGVLLGILVGTLIGQAMASALTTILPLPEWDTSFQFRVFALVGLVGFLIPFLATAWPVLRAVTVSPVEAIRPPYRLRRGPGGARFLRRLRLPGNTFAEMPVRNLIRSPRRSVLTALGIAAALAALIAFVGLIDSFLNTVTRGEEEIVLEQPSRIEVDLDRYYPLQSPQVQAVTASPEVARSEPSLRVQGTAIAGGQEIPLRIQVLTLPGQIWTPTLSPSPTPGAPGIYLSELAARNLSLSPGDTLTLRHPRFDATGGFAILESQVPVLGTHPHPFRFIAYMDSSEAAAFGLAGATNLIEVLPREGVSRNEIKRTLFALEGVRAATGVGESAEVIRDLIDDYIIVLRVIEGAMLLLALLIALNSATINMDERVREHATMFAFGVPVSIALRMAVVENFLLGIFATLAGTAGGWFLLRAIIDLRIPDTLPDLEVVTVIAPGTLAAAFALGVVAVALAPLFTWRRLARMDVASALKVVD